jgi:HSP20 family protein
MIAPQQEQMVPVRLYQSGGRLMLAAPMPGLEPENISVTIAGQRAIIRGEYRGPHQEDRDLLIGEWAIGPYYREIPLPEPVDGAHTNATYGNGVPVLVMPKRAAGQDGTDAEFRLEVLAATRGEHAAHALRDHHPTSTADRLRQQEEAVGSAAGH